MPTLPSTTVMPVVVTPREGVGIDACIDEICVLSESLRRNPAIATSIAIMRVAGEFQIAFNQAADALQEYATGKMPAPSDSGRSGCFDAVADRGFVSPTGPQGLPHKIERTE